VDRPAPCWSELHRLTKDNWFNINTRPNVVFLHARRPAGEPQGEPLLVMVGFRGRTGGYLDFEAWCLTGTQRYLSGGSYTYPKRPEPDDPNHLRIFAGQPDPADESHFTIR